MVNAKICYVGICCRSSHQRSSVKKMCLRSFTKFTWKHLCFNLSFSTLSKKRPWHRCFPVNFVKFLRTTFFKEHLWWLLLFFTVLFLYSLKTKYKTESLWLLIIYCYVLKFTLWKSEYVNLNILLPENRKSVLPYCFLHITAGP